MKERDRMGRELRILAIAREHEQFELEREETNKPVRKIILVAGLDYPRYEEEPAPKPKPAGWKPKHWVLRSGRKTPLRYPKGFDGRLSKGLCLLPSEKALKYDPAIVGGSLWRLRCLRLAVRKLQKDPGLEVYLYDLDKGLEELITLDKGTLSGRVIRRFKPLNDADYRVVIVHRSKDPKDIDPKTGKPRVLKWTLRPVTGEKFPIGGDRPSVRLFPFVNDLGTGELDHADWLRDRAKNVKWLDQYVKSPEAGRYLGIRDVYYHLEVIGGRRPYTLHELHLFGHASSSAYSPNSGTSFVNTDHVEIPGQPHRRNPLDLDARATLDFNSTNIDATKARMAFAKGALTYVWGCNWSRPLYDIIRQANDQLGSKKLTDAMSLKFRWRGTGGKEDEFRKLLKLADNAKTSGVVVSGAAFRELITALIGDTYMQRIADISARCAVGGLPGTWSDFDQKPGKNEPCLLNIPMGSSFYGATENLQPILKFYERHFGVPFHREGAHPTFGRGFALYCPRT
jgi:hypothetical protein